MCASLDLWRHLTFRLLIENFWLYMINVKLTMSFSHIGSKILWIQTKAVSFRNNKSYFFIYFSFVYGIQCLNSYCAGSTWQTVLKCDGFNSTLSHKRPLAFFILNIARTYLKESPGKTKSVAKGQWYHWPWEMRSHTDYVWAGTLLSTQFSDRLKIIYIFSLLVQPMISVYVRKKFPRGRII